MKTFVRFLYMQQELPFYRSKTFHRKKNHGDVYSRVPGTFIFDGKAGVSYGVLFGIFMDRKHRTSMRGNVILRRQEEKF